MNSALRMTAGPNETVVHSKSVKVSIDERSSSLNGRVDRFVTNIKRECLGKFILFGRRHLDYIVSEWVEYYNTPTVPHGS